MRIKLVTFAPHPNFGTCLQSYALNKVLRNMGHDVEFIYNGKETYTLPISYYAKTIVKYLLPLRIVERIRTKKKEKQGEDYEPAPHIIELPNNCFLYWLSHLPGYKTILKWFKYNTLQKKKVYSFAFEDGNYKMKRLYVRKQYDEVVQDADMFITGSDQIWNPYCGGFNPMMFLEFAGDKKRISYSSSIARPYFPKIVEERAHKDLAKFKHIAVREETSVNMLNNLLQRNDVQLVVDPTLLLSRDEWEKFGNRAVIEFDIPEKYIFCYFVGNRFDDYNKMVCNVMKETGIRDVITVDCTGGNINYGGGRLYKDGGPYEFVYLISHASLVCMDSFHATVFALKFGVDFIHILKTKKGSNTGSQNTRMYDFLNRYNLTYKLYDINTTDWLRPYNKNEVDFKLEKDINQSLDFLQMEIAN